MIRIGRIGHLTLETPDVGRKLDHFTRVVGLSVTDRSGDAVWLACPNGGPALLLRQGAAARPARLSLRLAPSADPADVLRELRGHGLSAERRSDTGPDLPDAVTFSDPNGLEVDLHPEERSPSPRAAGGVVPEKLGHVAFFVPDPQATTRFYCEVLGFRVSDWIGDFFAFLRCNPDHHSLNFFRRPDAELGLHHMAFELRDWNHVKEACDTLGRHRVPLTWGPGRHGAGHNIYTYHDDPDGQSVELFTELDRMSDEASGCFDPRPWHLDNPQRPMVWEPGVDATNSWGIPKPPRPA
ncbi:VOC family protein [Muricoccus aerilatus]|uniref:VOC family protein n=1 Tax=Muricoccus aerilatus TaxID=452982 RepID=UPI0005C1B927|nr:VOC family protein [Roseomonas aerilata]